MRIKTALALAILPAIVAISPAKAGTFVYEPTTFSSSARSTRAGEFTAIRSTYNEGLFTFSSTIQRSSNTNLLAEGAWLVVSDGDNPKTNVDEYAIMYMDGLTNQVSIFNYNGANSASSYQNGTYLGSTALSVIDNGNDERTFEFSLDPTLINADSRFGNEWEGIAFDENIGMWLHGASGLSTAYDSVSGQLTSFTYSNNSWYDVRNHSSTEIPEPGSVVALSMFAAAAATQLRKRKADAENMV